VPELPEAETVRRDLVKVFAGDRLSQVVVTGRRTVRRHPPAVLSSLEGRSLLDVGRLGKYLLFRWDDGALMVGHLRMSGQLLHADPGAPVAAHTHAVFSFAQAGEMRFVDPRTFGELFLAGPDEEELSHLGPDALAIRAEQLGQALAGRRAPLKSLLVDQRVVAGIGNIYADEICFAARLRGDRPGGSLSRPQVARLTAAVHEVLSSAIEARGSTLDDLGYRDLAGQAGSFQLQHRVYNRLGEPCTTCGRAIVRPFFGARSAFLCPRCQR
jgi:formamidopyrimidine-DNA glycosylase